MAPLRFSALWHVHGLPEPVSLSIYWECATLWRAEWFIVSLTVSRRYCPKPAGLSTKNPSLSHRTRSLETGKLMTRPAAPQCQQGPRHTLLSSLLSSVVQCCLHSGYNMAIDSSSNTFSHNSIQGRDGEALSMSLLKDEQHFPSSCPSRFLFHLPGQLTVCGHTKTSPWQGAWNCIYCLAPSNIHSTQQGRNLVFPGKHQP